MNLYSFGDSFTMGLGMVKKFEESNLGEHPDWDTMTDEQKNKPSSRTLSGIDQRYGGTDPALHQSNPDVPLFGTWEGLATQI